MRTFIGSGFYTARELADHILECIEENDPDDVEAEAEEYITELVARLTGEPI